MAHPIDTLKDAAVGMYDFITDPQGTAKQAQAKARNVLEQAGDGNFKPAGEMVGQQIGTTVVLTVVGTTTGVISGKAISANAIRSTDEILVPEGRPIGFVKGGATPNIRTVTTDEFATIRAELVSNSKEVATPPGYAGVWYQRPDGTIFGVRESSINGPTIDVVKSTAPAVPTGFKIHQIK